MPLGCLSDASKMPSWRNLQAAEQPVYGRRSLSCRRQHVGLQGLKKKRICHTQPRKPSGIGTRSDREISKNCLQIRRTQFVLASLQPYILTTLHYYVFIFPLRHFGLSAFRSRQNNTPKKRSKVWRRRGLPFVERTKKMAWEVFQRAKSDLCGKQKPPCYLFSDNRTIVFK